MRLGILAILAAMTLCHPAHASYWFLDYFEADRKVRFDVLNVSVDAQDQYGCIPDEASLTTLVEQRLRQAGIAVSPDDKAKIELSIRIADIELDESDGTPTGACAISLIAQLFGETEIRMTGQRSAVPVLALFYDDRVLVAGDKPYLGPAVEKRLAAFVDKLVAKIVLARP